MKKSIVFAAMFCLMCMSGAAPGATIYVPADQPAIQAGIDAAADGDVVMIADGTYTGAGNVNIDFNGKAITVRSASDKPATCIIDCENVSETRGFYFHNSERSSSVVRGLTIQNGNAGGTYPDSCGGGIYCNQSSPTITNCAITGNSADYSGGGIHCQFFSPTITNCTISGNSADGGGGIGFQESSPTITNCTISENSADGGGGISCGSFSSPTITNCTISENAAIYYGGGIGCWYSSSWMITDCTISGNIANYGGGIYCEVAYPTITNCTIPGNTARDDGGGIHCDYSSPTIMNCAISENAANGYGGGIGCDYSASPMIANCAIAGNTANYYGGGIGCDHSSSPTITNCTIRKNTANDEGGGIGCYDSSSPTITNCILWGDSATTGNEIHVDSGNPTANYCDIEGGCPPDVACLNCIDQYPQFVVGPGGDLYLNHAAKSVSPCIDAGSDSASNICFTDSDGTVCMDELTTRIDGVADSGTVDMGFHCPIPPPTPTPGPTNTPTITPTAAPHDGDVDNDGEITPNDSYLALQIYLGMNPPGADAEMADFCPRPNGDGVVDPHDAYAIVKEYLGVPDPC